MWPPLDASASAAPARTARGWHGSPPAGQQGFAASPRVLFAGVCNKLLSPACRGFHPGWGKCRRGCCTAGLPPTQQPAGTSPPCPRPSALPPHMAALKRTATASSRPVLPAVAAAVAPPADVMQMFLQQPQVVAAAAPPAPAAPAVPAAPAAAASAAAAQPSPTAAAVAPAQPAPPNPMAASPATAQQHAQQQEQAQQQAQSSQGPGTTPAALAALQHQQAQQPAVVVASAAASSPAVQPAALPAAGAPPEATNVSYAWHRFCKNLLCSSLLD